MCILYMCNSVYYTCNYTVYIIKCNLLYTVAVHHTGRFRVKMKFKQREMGSAITVEVSTHVAKSLGGPL